MKSALQFHPFNDKHFRLDYSAEFDESEKRAFKSRGMQLPVNFGSIELPIKFYNEQLRACTSKILAVSHQIDMDTRWSLAAHWGWLIFEPKDFREAFVFGRRIQHLLEDTIILAFPMTPAIGFTKTFDVRFEIPREIRNFEAARRSIIVRGSQ